MSHPYLTATLVLVALVTLFSLPTVTLSTPIPSTPQLEHYQRLIKRANATIITECTIPNSFAVTFDDGPSPWTHELLDYLAIKDIKVTFFVNGLNYVSILDPEFTAVVKRAYDEGHQIASHTWAHADLAAPGVDVVGQMKMLDDALLNITGVRPVYMRPPYGDTSPDVLAYLGEKGYKVVNWGVDSNDWRHPLSFNANFQAYRVALQDPVASSKGFISLQHDAERATAQIFSKLAIEYVLSKGFKIMPVASCLGDTTGWYRL
ncbi:chitin deacetylase [Mortierella sp. GBA30]|nr:chitin deacetylase [Mortierella sp. GBA30]